MRGARRLEHRNAAVADRGALGVHSAGGVAACLFGGVEPCASIEIGVASAAVVPCSGSDREVLDDATIAATIREPRAEARP